MPNGTSTQRQKVPVPHVSIGTLRKAKGLTLQAVCDHINGEHAMGVDRGTVSAIENGHRGASVQMLSALADALGISVADIELAYKPRQRNTESVA